MSKVDAQRALRDARYARFAAARAAEAKGGTKPPRAKPVELDPPPEAEALLDDSLLGETPAAVASGTGKSGAGKRAGSKSPAGKQSTKQAKQAAEVLPFSDVPLAEQTTTEADAPAVVDLRDASSADGVAVVETTLVYANAATVIDAEAVVEADAALDADAVLDVDAVVEADTVVEADAVLDADAVVETDTVVETGAVVTAAPAADAAPLADAADADGEDSWAEVADAGQTSEELCGHRSMSGRTCTRDKGHPQKNHRYN